MNAWGWAFGFFWMGLYWLFEWLTPGISRVRRVIAGIATALSLAILIMMLFEWRDAHRSSGLYLGPGESIQLGITQPRDPASLAPDLTCAIVGKHNGHEVEIPIDCETGQHLGAPL